ncbi:MAG: DUF4013 domain-containing protein [Anaerolineae bacterium]|nr:DUF4013 domain-containing protein [Anaerolineae bacterium]
MDLERAIRYSFDDQEWAAKLLIAAAVGLFALFTSPLLIGLVGWAALLGYTTELIRNVRDHHPTPLPRWDDYGGKIRRGGNVLAAYIVYNLPNAVPVCCFALTGTFLSDSFIGSTTGLIVMCCVLPVLLVYNLIIWPMLALGMGRYAVEDNIGVFFQFGDLFTTLTANLNVTLQWVLYTFVVSFVMGIVGFIPCVGWAAAVALNVAVQGHLTGQLAMVVEGDVKPKRKRAR